MSALLSDNTDNTLIPIILDISLSFSLFLSIYPCVNPEIYADEIVNANYSTALRFLRHNFR